MKVAVFGLGYVGLTAAACLTKEEHVVIGVDVSADKVAQVNSGKSPIKEPGLDDLLQRAVERKLLSAYQDPGEHLADCDIAIVCVGTPSAPDGSHNMSYIAEVSRQIAVAVDRNRKRPLTVVYRSTVRPGTIEELVYPIFRAVLGESVRAVELVYNPEFLRESSAISDYFNPPKIVIGTHDGGPSENMDSLHQGLDAPVFYTRYREAEFTKFVDNTFHAVKVAFANEIGRTAVELGIDPTIVHKIFVSDTKLNISPYYLRPGGAFGGSCLPKDVRALQFIASDAGANTHLVDSLIRSNESHKHFIFEWCTRSLPRGSSVLLVGLSFKADSDDLRESPNIDLARKMLQAGYNLSVFDPALEPAKLVGQNLGYAYAHLPELSALLVSEPDMLAGTYDLVVDARGRAADMGLKAGRIVDITRLR